MSLGKESSTSVRQEALAATGQDRMKDRRLASPAQCRAARALLSWTQAELAERSGVARKTIADFELAQRTLHFRTRRDITEALETAGIEFTFGDEVEGTAGKAGRFGDGLRFKKAAKPA
jgi:transcriptional regulator with XRE-family HTH domain